MALSRIILCGRSTQIGSVVVAGLKPEVEVIHFVMSAEAGKAEIPAILRGESVSPTNEYGTHDYSKTPDAVVLGGGYDEQDISTMRAACQGVKNNIPWLRPDMTKPTPPLGPEYGKAMVQRVKVALAELREKETPSEDGIEWF
ncbi:hypothetical protein ASPZODRAFT_13320 [Penicilliopsis zonata CBS 506.65]|uniref:Uncharacterized protein n=1 Tax=Penicilliopsis zonata CBS 506.65 TaxID=1073090 RepID=A0A1L9SSN2_9EURO|nr:hypothetical protein ASPZODRAFT_13320 [Penicilliopsis zonata CBS 506.65]OJJ50232.1 hypothetical protein ASPZODRAFT_13320 [Penicilliopsis zonata CBS 506.65]